MDEMSSAEFNFGSDPEAAKIVIEEMNTPITMVPWEVHYLRGAEVIYSVNFIKLMVIVSYFLWYSIASAEPCIEEGSLLVSI